MTKSKSNSKDTTKATGLPLVFHKFNNIIKQRQQATMTKSNSNSKDTTEATGLPLEWIDCLNDKEYSSTRNIIRKKEVRKAKLRAFNNVFHDTKVYC
jgi:hypothetical protein